MSENITPIPTSEALHRAADLIEEEGWVVGGPGWLGDGGYCLEGALAAALGLDLKHPFIQDHINDPVYQVLVKCPAYAAVAAYVETEEPLWRYNDRVDHTRVVEVLRAAAAIEAAKEEYDARRRLLVTEYAATF